MVLLITSELFQDLMQVEIETRGSSENEIKKADSAKKSRKCKKPGCLVACCNSLRQPQTILLVSILLGVLLGIGLGVILRMTNPNKRTLMYIGFIGNLFLRMLKMLILPLIVSSLVAGLAALDQQASGRMGCVAVIYYFLSTIAAVFMGIGVVLLIRPGKTKDLSAKKESSVVIRQATIVDTFLDLIRNMVPENIIGATIQTEYTMLHLNSEAEEKLRNGSALTESEKNQLDFEIVKNDSMNVLGLVILSCGFGIILGKMGRNGAILRAFFYSLSEATIRCVRIVMWFSPIGILFLTAQKVTGVEDFAFLVKQIGLYSVCVILGLVLHGFLVLPVVTFFITRKNPLRHIYGISQALVTAWGTASSSATLPITIQNMEDNLGIDPRVTRFVLPAGATVNMDGTALYEAVAVLFIAQTLDRSMTFGQVLIISLTATAASIGAAGIPQAGLVTMALVLSAVGLPLDNISIILSIDWFLDRCRTAVNVLGDSFGCIVVQKFAQKALTNPNYQEDNRDPDTKELLYPEYALITKCPNANLKEIIITEVPEEKQSSTPESIRASRIVVEGD